MFKITCDKTTFSKLVIMCEQIINRNGCGACVFKSICVGKYENGVLPIVYMTDIDKQQANIRTND